jgi:predicted aminopeptidase
VIQSGRMTCIGKWRCVAGCFALALLASCSTARFYGQALAGQHEMSRRSRPVAAVLTDPASSPALRRKLETARDQLTFAEQALALPTRGQYERYADLGRRHAVWVVFAAPEFSVEAKTWWYPLIGKLKYRGFFREDLARAEAERWRARGLDVFVGGVEAYSTLGWLRDPLLNTFLGRDDAWLADLLFHELTHQRIYLPGDTDFNEALATAVGQEGARRWLRARGRLRQLATFEKDLAVEREFVAEVLATRQRLAALYKIESGRPAAELRRAKQAEFERLKKRLHALDHRHGGSLRLDRWLAQPLNNARLNTVASYHELLPYFEAMLRRHDGDFEAFFREIEGLRRLEGRARLAKLRELAP